jgi:hypothetical protein
MGETSSLFRRYRVRAGYLLLLACALYASSSLLYEKATGFPGLPPEDPVSAHEKRIEPLRAYLPDRGAVGYVTGLEIDRVFARERALRDVELLGHFILTQYTLAPIFVYPRPDRPLVVGNFIGIGPDRALLDRYGLVPLKDFGDGLILYRRKD